MPRRSGDRRAHPEEIAVSIAAELIAVRRGVANAAHKSIRHILATPASAD